LIFSRNHFPCQELDGILLANALHYVKDKVSFLEKIQRHMKAGARMVIVEYDTEKANAWVPYPITFDQLKMTLALPCFGDVEKIGERNSIYRTDKIYACSYPKRA
jgi:ubiquinone/menaquinone biosynthesis C-methylase UbiE